MNWKPLLVVTFLLAFFITLILFVGTIDFGQHVFQLLQQPAPEETQLPCRSQSQLKVYMYDLPQRFNVGMINRKSTDADETPVTEKTLPPWPRRSGLNSQHSVEYWMMASLLYEGSEEEELEAVRVADPELADVFFVPFFSSLSVNTHGRNMTDPETEVDKQLQIDVVEFLRQSKYWQKSWGKDHVIPMHHPNAFRFMRQQLNASILVVADFGRYPKSMSTLRKDVVAPYMHVVESLTDDDDDDDQKPFESRHTLLFFRGRTARKSEGFIRAKLAKILSGYDDVHYEKSFASEKGIRLSTEGMRSSKFCLHLAGDTPSSCRLFDAIVSHCVPVIVSDKIELPYEGELDYSEFALFFSDDEALTPGYIVEHLREIPQGKWLQMWKQLKAISHHFEFQYPPKKDDAVNMLWRQVRDKVPAQKLAVHRSRRLKVPDWWRRLR